MVPRDFTCEDVYSTIAAGTGATVFLSFIPGASGFATVGSKSAYYGVRAARAFTNVASRLKKSAHLVFKVSVSISKLVYFIGSNRKKLIVATNSVNIGRMLPLLPPVVLGIYVMFGVFWPSRVVFFTAKQRRNHMSTRFTQWTLALIGKSNF